MYKFLKKGKLMKLFTKEILKKLPKYGELAEKSMDEITVQVKLFDCAGNFTWYIYEYDPETGLAMACVSGSEVELGSVYIPEIQRVLGWRLERDLHFSPRNLKDVYVSLRSGKHI